MSDDKLSVAQRREALVWFGAGVGWKATATMVGGNRRSFQQLYDRWKIHGEAVLMPRQTPRQFTAEFKREVVERFLAGESKPDPGSRVPVVVDQDHQAVGGDLPRAGTGRTEPKPGDDPLSRPMPIWMRSRCCVVRTSGCWRRWRCWKTAGLGWQAERDGS